MEVGRKGGPLSVSMVVVSSHRRIVASPRRGPGREECRDLSFKKVQFASDFLHLKAHKAHLRIEVGRKGNPLSVWMKSRRRIVASRTWSREVARAWSIGPDTLMSAERRYYVLHDI